MIIESNIITIKYYDVLSERIGTAFDKYKIVLRSDLHVERFTKLGFIEKVIEKIIQIAPDIVIIIGKTGASRINDQI